MGLSGVVMGCNKMAEMRGGEALTRATESCQGMAEMRGEGGAVASYRELPNSGRNGEKGKSGCELSGCVFHGHVTIILEGCLWLTRVVGCALSALPQPMGCIPLRAFPEL